LALSDLAYHKKTDRAMKFAALCVCVYAIAFSWSADGAVLKPVLNHRSTTTSQVLRDESAALNQVIQAAAAKFKAGDITFEFLRALRLCAHCDHYERFGEYNDGGYVMCSDGLEHGLVGAYSYGINGFDGWGMAVASRYSIPLHEYDCFNLHRPSVCHGCNVTFKGECVASPSAAPKWNHKSLMQQVRDAGNADAQEDSLLLKMDVEGAEWPVFADESVSSLKKFRQVVVEYHGLQHRHDHGRYSHIFKRMADMGFAVTHLHGNNCCGMAQFGQYKIPAVIEVTYVRRPHGSCSSGIPYRLNIDHPNVVGRAELSDAALPQ